MNELCNSANHYNWLFSTPTLFNTETPRLDGPNKVASERSVAIEEMTNLLEYFEDDLQLQKNETKERINQLEIDFATAFEDFEH